MQTTRNAQLPDDPVKRARYIAIKAAGGNTKVARACQLKSHESVRRWAIDTDPTPAQARALVAACDGVVTLQEVLPDAYAGLTASELGYQPEAMQS